MHHLRKTRFYVNSRQHQTLLLPLYPIHQPRSNDRKWQMLLQRPRFNRNRALKPKVSPRTNQTCRIWHRRYTPKSAAAWHWNRNGHIGIFNFENGALPWQTIR